MEGPSSGLEWYFGHFALASSFLWVSILLTLKVKFSFVWPLAHISTCFHVPTYQTTTLCNFYICTYPTTWWAGFSLHSLFQWFISVSLWDMICKISKRSLSSPVSVIYTNISHIKTKVPQLQGIYPTIIRERYKHFLSFSIGNRLWHPGDVSIGIVEFQGRSPKQTAMALPTALLLGVGPGLEMERRLYDLSKVVLTSLCEFE